MFIHITNNTKYSHIYLKITKDVTAKRRVYQDLKMKVLELY